MSRGARLASGGRPGQAEANRAVYFSKRVYRSYLSQQLAPPEVACLLKYQASFYQRDILDVGVGAGRTTRYLAPLARRYEAVDYSPVMVSYLESALPGISVHQADFCDLALFDDDSFDFVFAPDNVIDALPPEGRLQALAEVSRLLRPEGVFAFSAHNLRYKRAFSPPRLDWSSNPYRLGRNALKFAYGWWNHLRIRQLRMTTTEFALLNDPGHFYACLHYYAARPAVDRQLTAVGLSLIDVFDRRGSAVAGQDDDSENPSLLYVSRLENPAAKAGFCRR